MKLPATTYITKNDKQAFISNNNHIKGQTLFLTQFDIIMSSQLELHHTDKS